MDRRAHHCHLIAHLLAVRFHHHHRDEYRSSSWRATCSSASPSCCGNVPVEGYPAEHVRYRRRQGGTSILGAGFSVATFALCQNPVRDFATVAFPHLGRGWPIIFKKIWRALPWRAVASPQDPRTGLAVGDTRRIGLFALIICRPICCFRSADQPAVFRVGVRRRLPAHSTGDKQNTRPLGGDGSAVRVQKERDSMTEAEARQTAPLRRRVAPWLSWCPRTRCPR